MLSNDQIKLLEDWNKSKTPGEAFLRFYNGCGCADYQHCECPSKAWKSWISKISKIRNTLIKKHGIDWVQHMKVKEELLSWFPYE